MDVLIDSSPTQDAARENTLTEIDTDGRVEAVGRNGKMDGKAEGGTKSLIEGRSNGGGRKDNVLKHRITTHNKIQRQNSVD